MVLFVVLVGVILVVSCIVFLVFMVGDFGEIDIVFIGLGLFILFRMFLLFGYVLNWIENIWILLDW